MEIYVICSEKTIFASINHANQQLTNISLFAC